MLYVGALSKTYSYCGIMWNKRFRKEAKAGTVVGETLKPDLQI